MSCSRSRRAARKPEVRSGIGRRVSQEARTWNKALPAARTRATTSVIASCSLSAGMTTLTVSGSATALPVQLGLARAVEQVLEELAVAGDEVGHDAPLQRLESEDEEEDGEDRGLEVGRA